MGDNMFMQCDHNSAELPDDSSTNQDRPGDSSSDQSNTNDNNPSQNRPHDCVSYDNNEDSEEKIEKIETWKPNTPEEIRRYSCVGQEIVRYTPSYKNIYSIDIENALQGPMCFHSFEAVLGDYTIGRTYNIYALSDTTYSTEQAIQLTLEIPSGIYKKDRVYKMICVTKGGQPFLSMMIWTAHNTLPPSLVTWKDLTGIITSSTKLPFSAWQTMFPPRLSAASLTVTSPKPWSCPSLSVGGIVPLSTYRSFRHWF